MNDINTPLPDLTPLAAALEYTARGWSVIPVPYRRKKPVLPRWQQLRLTAETLPQYFGFASQNLGVLLGEPSGWLIDIDLDHARACELAPDFLPPTNAIFGHEGNPRSHWLYRVTRPVATKKYTSKSAGMVVELRSTGCQTVLPASVHESGEPITWEPGDQEPAVIDPELLQAAVKLLADAVLIELGEKSAPKTPREPKSRKPAAVINTPDFPATSISEGSRNASLATVAGKMRWRGCSQSEIETALLEINAQHCRPPLDATEVRTIAASIAQYPAGQTEDGNDDDDQGLIPLGQRDPASGRLVLSPKRTLPTAEAYLRQFHHHPEGCLLINYGDTLYSWRGGCYRELEEAACSHQLQPWLHQALRYIYNKESKSLELIDFESNPGTVHAALETIRSSVYLPVTTPLSSWRADSQVKLPPSELLPCRSSLLHLPTQQMLPPTPAFLTCNSLDFDPDPHAPIPTAWFQFLHQLFDDDLESLNLLQEWFGYSLTADTSQQKMLLIVGPKRSGKGTIARVLTELVGRSNVCGPTTSSLAGNFGLQPLIGKTLAIVSDARFHGENISTVVERLLCISGEDTITVDRKFKESLTLKLLTRFLFLTNEFPRLTDASGALACRFLILRLTNSFYGQEDPGLTSKLLAELPGILNWAIEGWQRLHQRGHFVMPATVRDAVQELEDLGSPVKAFVRENCIVGAGRRVNVDAIYDSWKKWCEGEGRQSVSNKQTFGRDLGAAIPGVVVRRGNDNKRFYEGIAMTQSPDM